jgi:hypothetical protein
MLAPVVAALVLAGCSSSSETETTTDTAAGKFPKAPILDGADPSTPSPPSTPSTTASGAPVTASTIVRTPECQAMYRLQSIRLRLSGLSADKQVAELAQYREAAEALKTQVPQFAGLVDERVALTAKSVQARGQLVGQDLDRSKAVDREFDSWWKTTCVDT